MIQHGTHPTDDKASDKSFRKTFGAMLVNANNIPDFNLHFGPVPNQNEANLDFNIPALPYGCTDYGTCQVANNEDEALYNPGYQESLTGANAKGGYDVRASLLTSVNVGLQKKGESVALATTHRRPNLFRIGANPDFFTGALTALWITKRSVSIGTPWYPQWTDVAVGNGVARTGIVGLPTAPNNNPDTLPWHNWVICGKKTINGVVHLIAMPSQGFNFGDAGFLYFPAEVIDYVMTIPGTCMFTVADADPSEIQTVGQVFKKNLYYGAVDADVAELQRGLRYLGYSIPDGITRVFASETRAALALYQASKGIVDDGSHFGPLTRYAINIDLNPGQSLFGALVIAFHTFTGL